MFIRDVKIIAIFAVLVAGSIGVSVPYVMDYFLKRITDTSARRARARLHARFFKIIFCLGIGVILATATIFMIPEGMERYKTGRATADLKPSSSHESTTHADAENSTTGANATTNSTLETKTISVADSESYPWSLAITTATMLLMQLVTTEMNWSAVGKMRRAERKGRAAVAAEEKEEEEESARVTLHVLELGVAAHGIIIGLAMGSEDNYETVVTLTIAVAIRQLFEGIARGGLLGAGELSLKSSIPMIAFYALATPIGIIAGMQGDWASPHTMGVFDLIAAGILLHMALTGMLAHVSGTHVHLGAHPGGANPPLPGPNRRELTLLHAESDDKAFHKPKDDAEEAPPQQNEEEAAAMPEGVRRGNSVVVVVVREDDADASPRSNQKDVPLEIHTHHEIHPSAGKGGGAELPPSGEAAKGEIGNEGPTEGREPFAEAEHRPHRPRHGVSQHHPHQHLPHHHHQPPHKAHHGHRHQKYLGRVGPHGHAWLLHARGWGIHHGHFGLGAAHGSTCDHRFGAQMQGAEGEFADVETFWTRLECWIAIVAGAAVLCIIGIWA